MFQTSNCLSSGGVLYKQRTVFHRASLEESSHWHDTNDHLYRVSTYTDAQACNLTLQRGVTSAARHSENVTCRGVTSTARHAALSHSFDYISTLSSRSLGFLFAVPNFTGGSMGLWN